MLETPSRHWWAVALRGAGAILFGRERLLALQLMLGLRRRRERRHDPAAAGSHHRPATA